MRTRTIQSNPGIDSTVQNTSKSPFFSYLRTRGLHKTRSLAPLVALIALGVLQAARSPGSIPAGPERSNVASAAANVQTADIIDDIIEIIKDILGDGDPETP